MPAQLPGPGECQTLRPGNNDCLAGGPGPWGLTELPALEPDPGAGP
jgi:hypothetical protein